MTSDKILIKIALPILLLLVAATPMQAADNTTKNEDFVIASLIVADPGDVLYSRVGHVGLHMRCPEHNLDYVFSYESEDVRNRVMAFLSGNLKMGMFAIPTADYLSQYKTEGRGVREYRINLPIGVKQELWRVLDNHMLEGANLPYDYLTYGCAHSTLLMIKEALDTIPINYGEWPERFYQLNRRELTGLQLAKNSPWTWCFLNLITNGSINDDCTLEDKIIMPDDLIEILQNAEVYGTQLLDNDPVAILKSNKTDKKALVTPLLIAIVLLIATMVCLFFRKRWMDYVLLAIQTILGLITVYLTFFSSLCCTEWSWLIVPFNPLPLLAWRWRRHWALPYAVILATWIIFILVWPHSLTDWPYIVLTISLIISYLGMFFYNKTGEEKKQKI